MRGAYPRGLSSGASLGRVTRAVGRGKREALKFRPATLEDEEQLTAWLATEVCPAPS